MLSWCVAQTQIVQTVWKGNLVCKAMRFLLNSAVFATCHMVEENRRLFNCWVFVVGLK